MNPKSKPISDYDRVLAVKNAAIVDYESDKAIDWLVSHVDLLTPAQKQALKALCSLIE